VSASGNQGGRVLHVAARHLGAFRPPDRIVLRDVRARSACPSLVMRDGRLCAVGDFLIHYTYTVTPSLGVQFVDVTGDANAIHRTSDVVAGALTASKILLPLEILFPTLRINAAKVKFTAFGRYDRYTTSNFQVRFDAGDQVKVTVKSYQNHEQIAEAQVEGRALAQPLRSARVNEKKVKEEDLAKVRAYFDSCNIDAEAYFQKEGFRDYTYPFAYVASLPSAEIVRQLHGQGGMLNLLTLQFNDEEKIPIGPNAMPEVRIEEGRKMSAFRRILTDVIDGVITYYKGSAIVNPDSGVL
jgi:hypothetical protein